MSHETLLEIHAHYATRGDRFFWWWQLRRAFARLTHQPLRAEGPVVSRDTLLRWLDYRAIRSEFVKPSVSSVPGVDADPLSFPFYSYLKACMVMSEGVAAERGKGGRGAFVCCLDVFVQVDFVVELLHIPSWMYFVILVATLPFRSALFCLVRHRRHSKTLPHTQTQPFPALCLCVYAGGASVCVGHCGCADPHRPGAAGLLPQVAQTNAYTTGRTNPRLPSQKRPQSPQKTHNQPSLSPSPSLPLSLLSKQSSTARTTAAATSAAASR